MNRIFIFILILNLSSCSILQKKEIELKGSFYKACDINTYRVLTFEGNRFTEERQRPHLGSPVYYGNGTYKISDNELTLHYEPFDLEDAKIEMDILDSVLIGNQIIHLNFYDLLTEKPLFRVQVNIYGEDGNFILSDFTNREGEIKVVLPINEELSSFYISAEFPFYPFLNFNTEDTGNEHATYNIYWRAGTQEKRTEGLEKLELKNYSEELLIIKKGQDVFCKYLREQAYNYWLNEELIKQKKENR